MYKQGDQVVYNNGVMSGIGEVVGVALIEQPVVGKTWIIRDLVGNIPNKTYNFNTFVCIGCHMKKD